MVEHIITEADLASISKAFGDDAVGLQQRSVSEVLESCEISDTSPEAPSERRIFEALRARQEIDGNRRAILAFIRVAMDPERSNVAEERYEELRAVLNEALAVCGLEVTQKGALREPESAQSLSKLAINLWTGNVSLVKTFWLYYFVGGHVVSIPLYIQSSLAPGAVLDLLVTLWMPIWVAYFVVMTVAVWRSATSYTGPKYWAILAKGMMIILTMRIAYQLIKDVQIALGA